MGEKTIKLLLPLELSESGRKKMIEKLTDGFFFAVVVVVVVENYLLLLKR